MISCKFVPPQRDELHWITSTWGNIMRKTSAAVAASVAVASLVATTAPASAAASPKAACTAVISPSKTVSVSALAQYIKPSRTKIQPTSFSIRTQSQGIKKTRTDFTLNVRIYTYGKGITQEYNAKKGTHTVNDLWGPTFSKLKTLPKGKNRINLSGWFDLNSNAYASQCSTAVSFTF
ncbi:hypothetical protein ACFU53_36325 [Streptomyces sp. NPDC057474]|uniref:hypothetical protein n=1 Tax=Streptomyces sp. NPDC057474 TaxID=3346144 RepID=UPI0036C7C01E